MECSNRSSINRMVTKDNFATLSTSRQRSRCIDDVCMVQSNNFLIFPQYHFAAQFKNISFTTTVTTNTFLVIQRSDNLHKINFIFA